MFRSRRAKCVLVAATMTVSAGILSAGQVEAEAAPIVQVCSTTGSQLCMNRAGGGRSAGTQVIAYYQNNGNNDFAFEPLSTYCGKGKVTLTCPDFNDQQINAAYDGAPIGEIESQNLCLAVGGKLENCSANGVVMIFTDCTSVTTCGASDVMDSYWTRIHSTPSWVSIPGPPSQPVNIGAPTEQYLDQSG